MTSISSIGVVSPVNTQKSDKAKKIVKTVVPVVAATVVTKKALSKSGVNFVELFKNGNFTKFKKSLINVLSSPINAIQNKFAKIGGKFGCAKLSSSVPVTGGSGLKASITTILVSALIDLVGKVSGTAIDYISNKFNEWLKPKQQNEPMPLPMQNGSNIDNIVQ